jgi:protein-disulfide isomerase
MKLVEGLIAAFVLFAAAAATPAMAEQQVEWAKGDMALGKADAPVTVIEYASMTCPHCAHFHNETMEAFKEKYVDTGKVRLIFREFPFDGLALRASMLARCAGPDRYFAMLGVLFQQQRQWTTAKDPMAALAQIGRLGGVSPEKFQACMKDEELQNAIVQSRLDAQKKHDVDSTPTFIIDGEKHAGALSLAQLDEILAKKLPKS